VTTPAPLQLSRHPAVRVVDTEGKGRGLVAGASIREDELLDEAPVIRLRRDELGDRRIGIFSYPFDWPEPPYAEAIALGVISLINHSAAPNAWFEPDIANRLIRLFAARDIAPGEEITIDYGIPLWFEERP
jgi:SET domain-containing protein